MLEKEMESKEPFSTSDIFNFTDGDVTIHSSDNVKFKLRSDLLRQSAVFDDMMTVGNLEPIMLSEVGSEVEVMLQWMHPKLMNDGAKEALNLTWFWRMVDKYDLSLVALIICTELRVQYSIKTFSTEESIVHLAFESIYNNHPLKELALANIVEKDACTADLLLAVLQVTTDFPAGLTAVESIVAQIRDRNEKIFDFSRSINFTTLATSERCSLPGNRSGLFWMKLTIALSLTTTEILSQSALYARSVEGLHEASGARVRQKLAFIRALPPIV